jgi:sec-independent protein translocase protein TatB
MLPSLGFNEIVILGILALIVVGPKDLPLLFRKIGRWTAKLRGMAQEFRTGFDELARQAELDELKREVDALRRTTSLKEIRSELTKPLPTLEDYAGIKAQPAIPAPPPAETPALEAPVEPVADVEAEKAADEEAARPAGVPEHADVAPIARSAP